MQEARAKDLAQQKKQAHIEYLAMNGMDGPRPCLYQGGKRI